ncbi:sugar phosphate isomerase/epimerase family protein [Microbacterium sp. NPDC055910]|uniref:sugar phosphate isomerase/epimerase family protein n=1 Tax=Microbacterium sp. NPDC055910 TaxID=3345659 RepID=UPI0035DF6369
MSIQPFQEAFLCASTIDGASLMDRMDSAHAAGYDGIGLRPGHVARALQEGMTIPSIRSAFAERSLELFEIGFLSDWWLPDGANDKSLAHEASLFRLKEALGGRHMMVIGGPLDAGLDTVAERFAGVCRRAAEHGLRVALEFLPWTDTRTVQDAWRIVEAAGEPNGGVVIDTWHFFRGGSTLEQLAELPGDRIPVIQLSDGPLDARGTELEDTFHRRRLPGAGEFDLAALLSALAEKSVTAPIGMEVLSDELRPLETRVVAEKTRAALTGLLASL